MKRSKIYDLGKSELQKIIDESKSFADVFRVLGMNSHGSNYKTLRKVIDEYKIDLKKINENRTMQNKRDLQLCRRSIPLEKIILGEHQKEYSGYKLKNRLIKEGYKEWRCENCKRTEWLGNPIPLQLHHKDGNHLNNKLDNLMLLCHNCHSLTDTFAGKNLKNKKSNNKG